MPRRKENIIYDDNATMVIRQETEAVPMQDEMTVIKQTANVPMPDKIAVTDILDTMTGFVIPRFNLVKDSDGSGECLVCGKRTAYKMRKLCVDCMEKHGKVFYEKARNAIENGEKFIVP